MNSTTSRSKASLWAVGLMLFALFFGAGNLIYPAYLGQQAGENWLSAMFGFLLTGAGLPLLGYRGHPRLAHTTNRASCTHLPQSAGVGA